MPLSVLRYRLPLLLLFLSLERHSLSATILASESAALPGATGELAQATPEKPPLPVPPASETAPAKDAAGPAPQRAPVPSRGSVIDEVRKTPLPGIRVHVRDSLITVTTDEKGEYRLPPLRPGVYFLDLEAPGFTREAAAVRVVEGENIGPIFMHRSRGRTKVGESEVIEVEETRVQAPQATEHVLSLREMQHMPGAMNDAVRAVQNLPGVARNPIGLLIVRGTEPQDTGYYVDGIRVPQIFHFLGLHTVVNTDLLQQVTFMPGNYGVRFGRTYGGVVDVSTSDDIPQKYSGYLGVDLLNTVGFARIPITRNQGLLLSVRRSYADFVLEKALGIIEDIRGEAFNVGIRQAPRYWDYQALYNAQLSDRNFLHAMLFGAHDTVRLVTEPPASVDPNLRAGGEAGANTSFDKALVRWRYTGDALTSQATVSFGPDVQDFNFGGIQILGRNYGLIAREDLNLQLKPFRSLTLRPGLDALLGIYTFDLSLPFDPATVGLDPLGESEPYKRSIKGVYYSPSPYLEADYDLTSTLKIVPGIRLDPFIFPGQYSAWWVDPRLAVLWHATKSTLLKASAGRFGENPPPFAIDPAYGGNTNIAPPFSLQYSAGLEQRFGERLSLEASGYYNDLRKLVIIPPYLGGNQKQLEFNNSGVGRNMGLEILLRHNPYKGFFGWVSYTLQKADRLDGIEASAEDCAHPTTTMTGVCWYPFDLDQTHILTAVGSYELPHGWTVGARFRYSTGVPYTPVAGAYYDVDTNRYQPLPSFSGIKNNVRVPSFNDLTLRVEKTFQLKKIKLNTFLEVMNVYNRSNAEQVDYSYDYKQTTYVYGLPIFPDLGFKAEF